MFANVLLRKAASFAALALLACSSSEGAGGATQTRSLFVVPESLDTLTATHFYDHPWPSDFRRDPDGAAHFGGFYNPFQTILIDDYIKATVGLLHGFSPAAAAYLRFTDAIDPASLPADPGATAAPESSVQIVDVDPTSPERGKRRLAQLFWQKDDGVYWVKDTLAVLPLLGYPLRPKTRYAVVVTRAVRAADGSSVAPSSDLEEVLGTTPPTPRTQRVHDLFAPSIAELASAGVPRSNIAHLTVFTTDDPTEELFRLADDVHASVPAPTAKAWAQKEERTDYDVYEASYGPSPNYQAGKIPFAQNGDGGNFVFDAAGKPVLQNTFDMRFSLVVPRAAQCPAPAAGYPIVLYAHGTGGDYRSIVDEGNSIGQMLAKQCLASMGVDQIFHGARPGAPPASDPNREGDIQLLFFNLNNPVAARSNNRQSAIDVVQQARLFTDSHTQVPASVSRTGADIAFDASKLLFFGHSQGGLNGPLFMAADGAARGGVLSGAGSMITIALLEKTKPEPSVAGAIKMILQLTHPEDAKELSLFHPVSNLAQSLVDTTDPIHYMPFIVRAPRPGLAPKSIFQTEGIAADGTGDSYAPPHGIEVGSLALGLPRMAPGTRPIAEATFGGVADVTIPPEGLSGNLAGGQASGVLAQFAPAAGDDGHFVVFDVPAAHKQAAAFCKNLADDPKGRVPAP